MQRLSLVVGGMRARPAPLQKRVRRTLLKRDLARYAIVATHVRWRRAHAWRRNWTLVAVRAHPARDRRRKDAGDTLRRSPLSVVHRTRDHQIGRRFPGRTDIGKRGDGILESP